MAAALASPTSVFADDDGFIIHLNNGGADAFKFSETKKITFEGDGFTVIDTQTNTKGSYFFDDVAKITFENVTTGIQGVVTGSEGLQFFMNNDHSQIMVDGLSADERNTMRIHTVAGTTVMNSSRFNSNSIDITSLPEGIYILTINNQTFKFKK